MDETKVLELPRRVETSGIGSEGLSLLTLEKMKVAAEYRIPKALIDNATVEILADSVSGALTAKLQSFVYAKHEEEYGEVFRFPNSLWDHIKASLNKLPLLKLKWQAKDYQVVRHIHRMCPHTDYCDQQAHFDWLRHGGPNPQPRSEA